jgi:8-amino-7-oxononanoate synthase
MHFFINASDVCLPSQQLSMDFLHDQLEDLKRQGLYRSLKDVEGPTGTSLIIDGRKALQFASNDYLGLATHPRLKAAAREAVERYGAGSGSSRLVCGNLDLNRQLEEKVAQLKQKEAALLYSTGYMANLGVITALTGEGDLIVSDEFNHASIVDACRLSRAQVMVYPHKRMDALEGLLAHAGGYRRRLIVTDGIFSMDGDMAPLPDLVTLAEQYACMLMVDDAHATGVLGPNGGGTGDHFGLAEKIDIAMGTFGKALGGFGAFVAGDRSLREFLINCSRPFMFTTGLPPPVIASALAALAVVEEEPELRARLRDNANRLRQGITQLGFTVAGGETQIIPLLVGDVSLTMQMASLLLEEGVFIQGIRPPSVPQGTSRLRITVSAAHSPGEVAFALEALENAARKVGII